MHSPFIHFIEQTTFVSTITLCKRKIKSLQKCCNISWNTHYLLQCMHSSVHYAYIFRLYSCQLFVWNGIWLHNNRWSCVKILPLIFVYLHQYFIFIGLKIPFLFSRETWRCEERTWTIEQTKGRGFKVIVLLCWSWARKRDSKGITRQPAISFVSLESWSVRVTGTSKAHSISHTGHSYSGKTHAVRSKILFWSR